MRLRGVNLGGWLVLEKWITPSLFENSNAVDEYTFCLNATDGSTQRLLHHRNTYITEQDFKWLEQHGINAVRLPIGYWALESDPPFMESTKHIDNSFFWAEKFGIKVLLDIHGAPGSQNGKDHSGRIGTTKWTRRSNIRLTLETLERFCRRYGKHPALWGIELLNEPGWSVPHRTLRNYYNEGHQIVRQFCEDSVAVIISDAFRPLAWNKFMANPEYSNIVLDCHLYQCFGPHDKALNLQGHLDKTRHEWGKLFGKINRPTIVGEWSLGLDQKTFRGMDEQQRQIAIIAYANAQLEAFDSALGWFFWTYKTEDMPEWSFRGCIEKGILPTL